VPLAAPFVLGLTFIVNEEACQGTVAFTRTQQLMIPPPGAA
jgi:hypothetical protein